MNYIGIDLHSTNSVIVVSDETGRPQRTPQGGIEKNPLR
jgi:hypothetical protein